MIIGDPIRLGSRLLEVVEKEIVPLTEAGVRAGNKLFGAAILRKDDGAVVVAGTNNEIENPLWHGEITAINMYYKMAEQDRPATTDCIFLCTHEPCSLCLSAITWSGFDNFYYLFSYQDSKDDFNIPHDLRILAEVFACKDGGYVRENAYWKCHDIVGMLDAFPAAEQSARKEQLQRLRATYAKLSDIYQASKEGNPIPLS